MTPFEAIRGAPNACQILPTVVTGGQPTPQQLKDLASTGSTIVVDLREMMEPRGFDEPAMVRELGMEYKLIPVGAYTMSDTTLQTLRTTLAEAGERTVFVHCGSGNRVGGALIPVLMLDQGMEEEDAVDAAMRVGLRSAELMEWGLGYTRRQRAT
jgi:protein tyrosine phosphatase (PTP) superfamily phosphohydrolase (DUF442 family)